MSTHNNKKAKSYSSDLSYEKLRVSPANAVEQGLKQLWGEGPSSDASEFEKLMQPENIERKEIPRGNASEINNELILFSADDREIAQEIQIIRVEIAKLVKTVKEVDFAIQKAVMDIPVNPGVYHLNFLERIKKLLKLVKQKLEDSKTWLKHNTSKKKQRGYWMQYKKKGTSFGLSSERNVATQSG